MDAANIRDFLRQTSKKYPNTEAVIDENGHHTFAQLNELSEGISELLNKHIPDNQTIIGIVFPNGMHFVAGLFGAVAVAPVMPVYTGLTNSERTRTYEDCGVRYILGERRFLKAEISNGNVLETLGEIVLVEYNNASRGYPLNHVRNPALIRFSSGTTGESKGVVLSHTSVTERTEAVTEVLGLNPGNRVLWVLPMAFHFIATVVAFVRYGITTIVSPSFFAQDIINASNIESADFLYVAPIHIRLLASDKTPENFNTLKTVISTSSGISLEDCLAFQNRFNLFVHQAYGIIEVGLPLLNKENIHPERIGRPSVHYEAAVLTEDFEISGIGTPGKFGLRGSGMFDAYIRPSSLKADNLKNNWFLTGDIAIQYPDGSFQICGREKTVINVSGNKVFPEEVEYALESYPAISKARVYASNHHLMGETVETEIVVQKGKDVELDELREYLNKELASFKIPGNIKIVEELKLTATGKKIRHGQMS